MFEIGDKVQIIAGAWEGSTGMISGFKNHNTSAKIGLNEHTVIVEPILHILPTDPKKRKLAKCARFGVLYGMNTMQYWQTERILRPASEASGISFKEAEAAILAYHKGFQSEITKKS